MKIKPILVGLCLVLAVGAGVFAFLKWGPKKEAAASDEEVSPPPLVNVQVGTLKRMTLHRYLTAYGTVEPAPATPGHPAAAARLAATVPGVIAKINIAEGQHVEKGDVLMELDSSTIPLQYAEEELARQEKLYAQQNTSLHNVQTAQAQLAMLRVTAPLPGTVTRLNVTLGAAVDTTTVVAEVVDLNRLTVRAEIPTGEAVELKAGQEANTLTDPPVSGPLSYISPTVDTNNGTVLARVQLPPGSGLRPGQFIQLRLLIGTHENCLAAPAESVVTDIEGASVIEVV
ncbi:MAG: efflux RND transporter periplasmic adaptor subunit, partial [Limisphaerales bacterium]